MTRVPGRRLLGVVALACGAALFVAAPASAHTLSGPQPANFRTSVLDVVPEQPGVEVAIVDGGTKVQLTNGTGRTVVVEGYEGEPYLRIGPDGVYENRNSAATYLNRSLKGGVVPPGVDVSPDAPPEWQRTSTGRTARWHDHRAHWMGEGLPPVVEAEPDAPHRISTGRIPFTVGSGGGSGRHEIVVAVDWVPGPDPLPWAVLALLLGIVGLAVAVNPGARRVLAGLVSVLVVVDIVHAVSYALDRPGSPASAVVRILVGSFASVAVWIVAVPTVVALWRGRSVGVYGALIVGLMIALAGGLTDLDALARSQVPTAGSAVAARAEVAIALGLGFGIAIGAVVALVRGRAAPNPPPTAGGRVAALVAGLDERELRRIVAGLDAGATLGQLVPGIAARCGALGARTVLLEVVAADSDVPYRWTLRTEAGVVVAESDGDEAEARIRTSFPTFLRLVGGAVTLDDASAAGRAETVGPPEVIAAVARGLPEAVEQSALRPPAN